MIKAILTGIFTLIISLVNLITLPINLLISSALPELDLAMQNVSNLFNIIGASMGWVISLIGISEVAINILTMYYLFSLTYPAMLWTIKLALGWYDKLKP